TSKWALRRGMLVPSPTRPRQFSVTESSVALPPRRRGATHMLDTQNQGPQCTACGSPMKVSAIEPSALGQDLRTFSCPRCNRVQRHIIESTVTVPWLAQKKKPPPRGRLFCPAGAPKP